MEISRALFVRKATFKGRLLAPQTQWQVHYHIPWSPLSKEQCFCGNSLLGHYSVYWRGNGKKNNKKKTKKQFSQVHFLHFLCNCCIFQFLMTLEKRLCVVRNKRTTSHSRLTVSNIHDIRKPTKAAQRRSNMVQISCALPSDIWLPPTTIVKYYALPRVYCPYALERQRSEYFQKINTTTYFCLWNDALLWNHDEHTFTMESYQKMIDDEIDWVATV